ncbi:hypothetical protein [Xylophilus sp.]|uniref:hypothetical protein n=1 Tax=Xylophilus sp. TaxID=2653893 RepID=UPI0013BA2D22|nr:hypothetical protein [Xylophilus sp.]KAF1046199.1 MAG: hypothetical protein GAK38_02596 [Xylophilus sp.]
MNTLTIADIKRSGMHAIDAALRHGPAHLMKRNRRAAVLLSEAQYAALLAAAAPAAQAEGQDAALTLLLSDLPAGALGGAALAERAAAARGEWE